MGDTGFMYRPIAPRSAPPGGAGGAGGGQPPGYPGGGPPDDGRMKRASTACKECQRRRTRCVGGDAETRTPCAECLAHNRECVFDELADRRRKAAARKTEEELTNTKELLDQVLDVMRGDDAQLQHLRHVVRSGASYDNIRAVAIQLLAQSPHIQFPGQPGPHYPHNPGNYHGLR